MGLMMCDGKFVSRDEVALVPTPSGTESWKPVLHPVDNCRRIIQRDTVIQCFSNTIPEPMVYHI